MPQEAGPYVTRLVEQQCCAQLDRVVELWRPPSATCLMPAMMPFRWAGGATF